MIKYSIQQADSTDKLLHKINSLTGKGWATTGGISGIPIPGMHTGIMYFVLMAREEKKRTTE